MTHATNAASVSMPQLAAKAVHPAANAEPKEKVGSGIASAGSGWTGGDCGGNGGGRALRGGSFPAHWEDPLRVSHRGDDFHLIGDGGVAGLGEALDLDGGAGGLGGAGREVLAPEAVAG